MTRQCFRTRNLNELIDASCGKFGDRPLTGFAFQAPFSYREFRGGFLRIAGRLRAIGVKKGDRVAILAENSPRWGMAYMGVVRLGAVAVPILPDFPESDVLHILSECRAKVLFTTAKQIDKISELTDYRLEKIVTLDDFSGIGAIFDTAPFSELLEGDQPDDKTEFKPVAPDDLASIIYTSGTSGHSKAVMLSHGNLSSNVDSASGLVNITPDWTFLSVLPISHTYEFTVGFLLPIRQGARIVYCDQRPTPMVLGKICSAEKPTVMCVVPMILEKIYKKRVLPKLNNSKVLRGLLRLPFLRARILNRIGARLLDFFGGELRLMAIGGAAFNIEVEKFFHEAGFPYIVGYGLTETSPILAGGPAGDPTIAVGSCGKPVPGVAIKIVNPASTSGIGEIHAKGPNVMKGYHNNPEATAATIDSDGWLATGDLGYLDENNNLFISGRSKSVIVLSHGENIYPEAIEDKINSSIYVVESLVTEFDDKLIASVFPDYECFDLETKGKTETGKHRYIMAVLEDIRKTVNRQLPPYAQIHRLVERQEPFTKTATHKIKRYLYTGMNN
ncbi:MAG: AMP-binding protein [Desulfurivibrionaceae bacterium]|nr:AMP-binding protein [Desulfobulbales bacterium]MDT8334107.1 AMP-binding protein [Desulfurivibrionaceae bacterium]